MLVAVQQTWLGLGRYGTQFATPMLIAAAAVPGGGSPGQHWGRRAAAGSLLLGPPLSAWLTAERTLDPARFALGRIAHDIAYGLGVWSGCLAGRTLAPIRPVVAWHPLNIEREAGR